MATTAQKEHVCKSEASLSHRLSEINALRACNDTLYTELTNERMLRYAETERCAKIALDYEMSPVVGKAIAALIMHGGMETISAPVEPKEVYSPHTAVSN